MESNYILEMHNCRKEFPGVVALDNVSLFLKRGEVHALMGENGAGKSTIMKILAGIYRLDSGEILYDGKPFEAKNPATALKSGISMVHQELDLVPDMTVEMNVFAGQEKVHGLTVDKKRMISETSEIMASLGLDINPKAKVWELSVAQMQMVAIVKAIAFNSDIIIMDEPTSAITERETKHLFEIIRKLKSQNKAIVYISHRMDEIFEITDRITVLRDGQLIDSVDTKDTNREQLIQMMVGRDLKDMYVKNAEKSCQFDENETLLRVENLSGEKGLRDINFEVKRGEILGIYGLMGAGRTEMVETVFGLRKAHGGKVSMMGSNKKLHSPRRAIDAGIGFISEDRKLYGLNLVGSVRSNVVIAYLEKTLRLNFLTNARAEKRFALEKIKELSIKTPSMNTLVGSLSGGNQQKVIIGKWLLGNPDVLIMDEPTRGIDIGAKAEIYKLMDKCAKQGKAIVMISSEMPELLGMSDRIIVMHEGEITGVFSNSEDIDQHMLMSCAIGERGIKG